MIRKTRCLQVGLITILVFLPVFGAFSQTRTKSKEKPIQVVNTVSNHNALEYPGGWIPLPRILLANGHWYVYGSTQKAVQSGNFTQKNGALLPTAGGTITLDLSITSHLIYFWLSLVIALAMTAAMARRYKRGYGRTTHPRGWFQNMFEAVFIFIRDEVADKNLSPRLSHKYLPFLFGVFLLILFMNLFSLVPWAETATADITVTAVLAVVSFIFTEWESSKEYWEEIFWYPGVPAWVRILLIPSEFIGIFTKPFALAVRLYANMLSGKIMIICLIGLIFLFAQFFNHAAGWATAVFSIPFTVAIFILKFLISLIQAYIFVMLTAVFIGLADRNKSASKVAGAKA
jgi:F-type H+-transporting ATPase subunit a